MKTLILRNQQFLLYCVIGFSGVTLDLLVYSALVKGVGLNYEAANALSYGSGTILSFILNSQYNFKTRDRLLARFLSFCLVAFLGWLSSAGLLYWLVQHWQWAKISAKCLTLVVVVLLQYNLNRLFSFRASKTASHA